MKKIAVLVTCFNRKEKTLKSIACLYDAANQSNDPVEITVYLTDDASTDGTSQAIKNVYPEVEILKGSGTLYWSGGMRNSWKEAMASNNDYDFYLLLNDDTNMAENAFDELFATHEWCLQNYHQPGIYVAYTANPDTGKVSYGAKIVTNYLLYSVKDVPMSTTPQLCDLGNANIMLVPKEVVQKIGILGEGYIHGKGDYDYTLRARKMNIPVLTTSSICGTCVADSGNATKYKDFDKKSFKERKAVLYNPVGLDFDTHILYMKRHFPLRVPIVYCGAWFKVLFPKVYLSLRNLF